MPLWREGTLPVGFERIKRNNNDNVPRKRDKERDKNVFIHYHSHTQIRYEKEASGYLEKYPPSSSLSLLSSEPVDSQTHPALFYNRPYIPFVAWKRTARAVLHSLFPSTLHVLTVRALLHPPPPPISLTPISSPSPIPFSQFAPCPRDISPRIQLG